MPEIIACPQCKGKLKLPEALLGKKVRCPECKNTFVTGASAPVAAPPPLPQFKQGVAAPPIRRPAPPPPADVLEIDADDLIVEEEAPRSRGSSGNHRRRQEAAVEQPRQSRHRGDDYDDEPRRARRRRRRDEDFDDDGSGEEELDELGRRERYRAWSRQCGWVRLGFLLNFIGALICAGAGGLLLFVGLLLFAGVKMSFDTLDTFSMLAGLPALGGWITGAVGLGFIVVAPNRNAARGLAIAAAVVGGVHLIFIFVLAFGETSTGALQGLSGKVKWTALVSNLPYLNTLTLTKIVEAVPLLTSLLELAHVILLLLCLWALANFAKEWGLIRGAMGGIIAFPSTTGALLLFNLVLRLSTSSSSIKSEGGARAMAILVLLLNGLPLIGMYVWSAFLFNSGRNNIEPPRSLRF